eukprot:200529-Chlamydomonas_euryale.AAC.1
MSLGTNGLIPVADVPDFLERSGLSRKTLHDIWELVAKKQAFLDRRAFYRAMDYIALAQAV